MAVELENLFMKVNARHLLPQYQKAVALNVSPLHFGTATISRGERSGRLAGRASCAGSARHRSEVQKSRTRQVPYQD